MATPKYGTPNQQRIRWEMEKEATQIQIVYGLQRDMEFDQDNRESNGAADGT